MAQREGAALQPAGRRFVKYWLHAGPLLVEGRKMSKSLSNFFTLRDLFNKGFTGREIRYSLLAAHYRETLNFTLDGLQSARGALERLDECLAKLRELAGPAAAEPDPDLMAKVSAGFAEDLNLSAAWGAVFDWVRETNRLLAANGLSASQAAAALAAWQKIDDVFGLGSKGETEAPPELLALLEARQAARKEKD